MQSLSALHLEYNSLTVRSPSIANQMLRFSLQTMVLSPPVLLGPPHSVCRTFAPTRSHDAAR